MLLDPQTTASIARDEVNACDVGEFHDYGLVVTGHSLGAATAVLAQHHAQAQVPESTVLRVQSTGLHGVSSASEALCNLCDLRRRRLRPSLRARHWTSAEELRDQVIDLIGRSKVGKSAILRQVTA
ncbi:hypothetical protein PINS_up024390 [Pythium insidiosum]|nr:hypothetical protein PINS_up024390 [Pythium insidiosum]